jgi:hypothetical protein
MEAPRRSRFLDSAFDCFGLGVPPHLDGDLHGTFHRIFGGTSIRSRPRSQVALALSFSPLSRWAPTLLTYRLCSKLREMPPPPVSDFSTSCRA